MKDIDFDELDKAVNSLMATSSTEAPISSEPIAPPLEAVHEVPAVTASPSDAIPVTVNVPPRPDVSAPASVPTPRRSGKFMDMVHTSSDMTARTNTVNPSREGISISPRPEVEAEAEPVTTNELAPAISTHAAPEPEVTMPDPIDMAEPAEPPLTPAPQIAEETPSGLTITPADTPFLSDAKVEKRPLNPGSQSQPDEEVNKQLNELGFKEALLDETLKDDELDEPPVNPEIPELKEEVTAVEADESPVATQTVETAKAASEVEPPQPPLGATSISQQYTPKASTGDQSHAAIYDASQYPEPVSHPAKKKSGWLWVLWVVLLLGLGAGAAVLLYTFGIIP